MANDTLYNQGVTSRVAAAYALAKVFEKHHTLDEAFDITFRKYILSDADRRFIHAICAFVFRNLNTIDTHLRRIMNRKRDASPRLLHQLLRVGAAQLLYMEVAEHAALHSTVSAAASLHLGRQKGLVNAILRTVQRERDVILAQEPDAMAQLPEWLKNRWIKNYGELEAKDITKAMQAEAPIDISIKDAQASHEWAQKLGGESLVLGSVRVHQGTGQLVSWPGFDTGDWWVQDLAASLPINMLGDVANKSVLDLCAAPGGKTMQLASRGAKVTALDIASTRLERITENLARIGQAHNVQCVVSDALKWQPAEPYDIVVCDAPCTSTGTLRRHPELPWIHEENQLARTAASQRDLLRHAANLLRSGGYLLYCTCSLEVEEGENQLESFLNQHKDFKEIEPLSSAVQPFLKRGIRNIGWRTYPQLLADKGGMDGFFMALLQKQ